MSESLSIRLVEHQPILRERLVSGLQTRGVQAHVGSVVEPGLWLVNVDDESEHAHLLFDALCASADARVVISSVRADLLDEHSTSHRVAGQIRRPFTLDQLRAYLVEVATGASATSQEVEPAAASHLDTMLDLSATASAPSTPASLAAPDETIEVDRVAAHTPLPAPPIHDAPEAPESSPSDSTLALTVRVYAEAASELMPSWAALEPGERVRVMEEFFLRLSREFTR